MITTIRLPLGMARRAAASRFNINGIQIRARTILLAGKCAAAPGQRVLTIVDPGRAVIWGWAQRQCCRGVGARVLRNAKVQSAVSDAQAKRYGCSELRGDGSHGKTHIGAFFAINQGKNVLLSCNPPFNPPLILILYFHGPTPRKEKR